MIVPAPIPDWPDYGLDLDGTLYSMNGCTATAIILHKQFDPSNRRLIKLGKSKLAYLDEMMVRTFYTPPMLSGLTFTVTHINGDNSDNHWDNLSVQIITYDIRTIVGAEEYTIDHNGVIRYKTDKTSLTITAKRNWPYLVTSEGKYLNIPVALLNSFGDIGQYDTIHPKPFHSKIGWLNKRSTVVVPASIDRNNFNLSLSNWYWRKLIVNPLLESTEDWRQLDRLFVDIEKPTQLIDVCWRHGIALPCSTCDNHERIALNPDCSGCQDMAKCTQCPAIKRINPAVPLDLSEKPEKPSVQSIKKDENALIF